MSLSKLAKEFLEKQKENTPPATPPKEKHLDAIEKKRAELELKKLEVEIEKIQTPNTSIDYFKSMLEMQDRHFKEMFQMSQKQAELERKIAQLELSDGGDNTELDILNNLLPLLPDIIKNRKENPPTTEKEVKPAMQKIPTAEQMLEIKQKIKTGEITEEQFIKDAITAFPNLADKTQQIKEEYFKLKNG